MFHPKSITYASGADRLLCRMRVRCLRLLLTCSLVAGCASMSAHAQTFDALESLTQDQFELLMSNLAAATHYKGIAPAEPLGILGADVAFELSSTDTSNDVFELAGGSAADLSSTVIVPRLHAHKGLPFGFDVGAFLGAVADTDITIIGLEVRYALIQGGILTPALAVRASASRLQGTSDIELDNAALEITLSKGFLPFTPYVGAGIVFSRGSVNGISELDDVSFDQEKLFIGVNVNLGINFGVEAEITGEFTTFSAKTGIRF